MGWEFGSLRAIGKGLEDLTTAAGGERFSTNSRTLMGYVAAMALYGAAYQFFKTGSTPLSTGYWNFVTPLTRPNDPFSAVQIPGEEKEAVRIYSLLKAAGSDPLRLARVPFDYGAGKVNPVVRDVTSFLQAKDTHDFLRKALGSITPLMTQNSSPNAALSPFEQWLGIRGAPRAITGAPAPARPSRASNSRSDTAGPLERQLRREKRSTAEPRSHHANHEYGHRRPDNAGQ